MVTLLSTDSPVFSPVDGGSWMLAKMVVQATDYAHSQMIEHLLKVINIVLVLPMILVLRLVVLLFFVYYYFYYDDDDDYYYYYHNHHQTNKLP